MKYLLMTEAEYYSAISAAKEFGRFPAEYRQKLIEAEAACRAREVPEWATHFARITYDTDDDNNPLEQLNRFQFIERMGRK